MVFVFRFMNLDLKGKFIEIFFLIFVFFFVYMFWVFVFLNSKMINDKSMVFIMFLFMLVFFEVFEKFDKNVDVV